ncbi:MAG TPA: hypothetical protein VFP92_10735 [Rhodanobacteraceae bacterium]|nr:hypothetical protein [Rhodanobacteraceae bacterium]
MNYVLLGERAKRWADELMHDFHLSREVAERIACRTELEVEKALLASQDDELFVREYRELGPVVLSEVMDCHRDTLRRRFNAANAEKSPKKFGT